MYMLLATILLISKKRFQDFDKYRIINPIVLILIRVNRFDKTSNHNIVAVQRQ